jgi:hypothetical protein
MIAELPLVGAGGEPVDFRRTLGSHGVAALPPSRIDEEAWTLEVTLPSGRGARTVRVSEGRPGYARVEGATSSILAQLRHMFRLDEDLAPFYALARDDPQLAWAAAGAGRMLRGPTVFEDVVKTVCTRATPGNESGSPGEPSRHGEGALVESGEVARRRTPGRRSSASNSLGGLMQHGPSYRLRLWKNAHRTSPASSSARSLMARATIASGSLEPSSSFRLRRSAGPRRCSNSPRIVRQHDIRAGRTTPRRRR